MYFEARSEEAVGRTAQINTPARFSTFADQLLNFRRVRRLVAEIFCSPRIRNAKQTRLIKKACWSGARSAPSEAQLCIKNLEGFVLPTSPTKSSTCLSQPYTEKCPPFSIIV